MEPTPNFLFAELLGQDRIEAHPGPGPGQWVLNVIGCRSMQILVKNLQQEINQDKEWTVPAGRSHSEILLREIIQKMRGQWQFPVQQEELCHCRAISTQIVDQAIIAGAHTIQKVRRWTSANSACGTCLPEVTALFDFRLQNKT